jgi:hypothetical protein
VNYIIVIEKGRERGKGKRARATRLIDRKSVPAEGGLSSALRW